MEVTDSAKNNNIKKIKLPKIYLCKDDSQKIRLKYGYASIIASLPDINITPEQVSNIIYRYNSKNSILGEKSRLVIYYAKKYARKFKDRNCKEVKIRIKMEN